MLSLALVVSLGGLARASYNSISGWLTWRSIPICSSRRRRASRSAFSFSRIAGRALSAIPGVAEVQLVRDVRIEIQGMPIMIVAADVATLRRHAKLPPVAGNTEEMYRLAAEGKGVLASENFALLRGFNLGEVLEFPAPAACCACRSSASCAITPTSKAAC